MKMKGRKKITQLETKSEKEKIYQKKRLLPRTVKNAQRTLGIDESINKSRKYNKHKYIRCAQRTQ